ncbi:hypothetical protein ACFXPX_38565 [Kitasatospora sp. NPDC059146]|uniref:hypothetical protein n=1 Tax=unclassified Kitasatospora TaxID=2633591 RepID=UPI0036BE7346
MRIRAIHPCGCGCNCCGNHTDGDTRPLDRARPKHVIRMLTGKIQNQSGAYLLLDARVAIVPDGDGRPAGVLSVTATALDAADDPLPGCHWDLGAGALPALAPHLR